MPVPRPARRTRPVHALCAAVLALTLVLITGGPAHAVTAARKLAVLTALTQSTAASYDSWNTARQNPGNWAAYRFDWGTDHCSASPDRPLGFDFALACHRHDFGYRNHKTAGVFDRQVKNRIDRAFHADLRRRCAGYPREVRPVCLGLARIYYQAVVVFGSLAAVDRADVDAAADRLP